MDVYQSLVAVNPVTLIAQICNLFIQLFVFKKFFWDKILAILDQRREAADKEITDAKAAHAEANEITSWPMLVTSSGITLFLHPKTNSFVDFFIMQLSSL